MFMDAGRGECAGARADRDFPLLEVGEEGVPLLVGGSTVFLAGPGRAAAGDECPVGLDRLGRVDGLVADRGADVLVAADDLGDVGRQAAHETGNERFTNHAEWVDRGVRRRGYWSGLVMPGSC